MLRRSALLSLAAVGVTAVTLAAPGAAYATGSSSNSTNVTFTLTGGSLTISTPTAATLTSGGTALTLSLAGGQSVSGSLGTTTVTDAQGELGHEDTVTMAAGDFTDSASDTVAKANATGYSGVATPNGSLGVATPTLVADPASIGSSGGASILTMTGVLGTASVTYSPTVTVAIPNTAVAGTYSGTVTQTVSSG